MLRSLGRYSVPAMVAGRNWVIDFDIIDSDIPLLMSKGDMKQMKMKIDLIGEREAEAHEKATQAVWTHTKGEVCNFHEGC